MAAERGVGDGVTGWCAGYDALALRDVTEALDVTIKLIGTPAEESGEGRVQRPQRGYSATW
jgi:metal-dependent amidase/aminoacylase/carboxypeptidase family protein